MNRPKPEDLVKFRFEIPKEWSLTVDHRSEDYKTYESFIWNCWDWQATYSHEKMVTVLDGTTTREELAVFGPLVERMWRR